jgi:hypothetical protein
MGFRKFEVVDVGLVKRLRLMTLTGASMAENLVRVRGGFLKKKGALSLFSLLFVKLLKTFICTEHFRCLLNRLLKKFVIFYYFLF